MGGQACVFYGAAEFSRDCDIVIVADAENFTRLSAALHDLQAECIAVPPCDWSYLERGHAIHFRCHHTEAAEIRLDVMSRMRGCGDFASMWKERTTLEDSQGMHYELLGIEDLVRAKKTQRDKDWPMIRRLVDAHYDQNREQPTADRIRFWLRESRTPAVLIEIAAKYPDLLNEMLPLRPLLTETLHASKTAIQKGLDEEQAAEKAADRLYWQPLIRELESLRRAPRN